MEATHSDQVEKLAAALSRVQAHLANVPLNKKNPHWKSRYADLTAIWDTVREPLATEGLAVVQTLSGESTESVSVVTTLLHTSGQWIRGCFTLKPSKADPQGLCGAVTYARRYSLAAMVGVSSEEDDDGNGASGHTRPVKKTPATSSPAKPAQTPPTKPRSKALSANQRMKAMEIFAKSPIEQADWFELQRECGVDKPDVEDWTDAEVVAVGKALRKWEAEQDKE